MEIIYWVSFMGHMEINEPSYPQRRRTNNESNMAEIDREYTRNNFSGKMDIGRLEDRRYRSSNACQFKFET